MAKNRVKQREHLNCGMSKEDRLMKEAAQMEAERARMEQKRLEEQIDLIDYCGIKDPTPYLAVKNIIRKERAAAVCQTKMAV
jgi:hypothetical protein